MEVGQALCLEVVASVDAKANGGKPISWVVSKMSLTGLELDKLRW